MARHSKEGGNVLIVPLDASGVADFTAGAVKVVACDSSDRRTATVVELDKRGKAEARLELAEDPGDVQVLIGPADADDAQLQGLETLEVRVPARAFLDNDNQAVTVAAVRIPTFYWFRWLRWCRKFVVRGRVVCPDGRPVPGATVCAADVDRWWWWCSEQTVGCTTTDINGAFTLEFTWCCGFRPWWWWRQRTWRVEPLLAERIAVAFGQEPELGRLPVPTPDPDPVLLQALAGGGTPTTRVAGPVDPSTLDGLRARIVPNLPTAPDLVAARLWPWAPWQPWWDCAPDLVFRVTQNCGGTQTVLLDESCLQARPNVAQTSEVTLVTSDQACCVPEDHRCGRAECLTLTDVCDDLVTTVGGNLGAPAAPEGYRSPGALSIAGDRPYAEDITIDGVCGDWIDYYEFELSADGGATWNALPADAAGGFTLTYFQFDGTTFAFGNASFSFSVIGGRLVAESRRHWEVANPPPAGFTRVWVGDADRLIVWKTTKPSGTATGPTALFADGIYRLRLRAWDDAGGGALANGRVPDSCGTQTDNYVTIRIDNRLVGPGAGHPTTPDHPCVGVHVCTTEPDTDVIAVRINGQPVAPCNIVDATDGGTLEIDLLASDPAGHLAYYTLRALYGENAVVNLLSLPSASLTRLTAAQVGPTYAQARTGAGAENLPAATAPTWNGGTYRLTVGDLREAFPTSCAYVLDLWAYKRTIVGCNDNYVHRNESTFALTVMV